MNKEALVIGLGIGQLYKEELEKLGYTVYTIDSNIDKSAMFLSIAEFYYFYSKTEHTLEHIIICTPNYLHDKNLQDILSMQISCNNIIVEKPGLHNLTAWENFSTVAKLNGINLIMVKNNVYRLELENIKNFIIRFQDKIKDVDILWQSSNRVPYPGSWFTDENKDGGVTKDIMPHLLHYFYSISNSEYLGLPTISGKYRRHTFEDVKNTAYGVVQNNNPVYTADDNSMMSFVVDNINYNLIADWKTDLPEDDLAIHINMKDNTELIYKFGLCPNELYGRMIYDITTQNKISLQEHNKIDNWIHNCIDNTNWKN